jgi:tetratricopeptide (TPR) repeat protein
MAGLAGNTTKKLQLLNQAEKSYPNSRWLSSILLEEARTYEETGRTEQAAEAYKKRLLTSTNVDVDELFTMASTMHNAGKWEDLLEVTDRIRRAGQLDTDELADLDLYDADAYNHTGQSAKAAKIYQQLAGTPTSLTGSKAAVSYGHYLLSEKRYADAEAAMLEFTDSGTPYEYWLARGYIVLADAYSGLGKDYLAKEYLQSLKENYPGDEDDIADMIATRLKRIK